MRVAVLRWFDEHGRTIDFRASASAYGLLVGEVMAQQTQVSRVEPAWRAFMAHYPDPESLASAPLGDVLRAWAGLGYNSRALNLQRAAAQIVREHGGRVPHTVVELERLAGVGPYTARALAAVAFGLPVGAVDTNARRVLTRLRGPARAAELQWFADELVDPDRPADWTHALMDVGATICRPARTDCARCPMRPWCASGHVGVVRGRVGAARGRTGSQGRDGTRTSRRRRSPSPRFDVTTRWLRGRLMARLRDAPPGAWVALKGPLGIHSAERVREALDALTRQALVERDVRGRFRLPVAPAGATGIPAA
jgi:A/G-specific adenine glycosylase